MSQTEQQPTTEPTEASEPEGGSRRYPRTFGGLIGSMIVLVLIVVPMVLVVTWRGNETRAIRGGDQPRSADWAAAVVSAQEAKLSVVYPRSLPTGWYANTDPTYTAGEQPDWTMSFVKGKTSYVGVEWSARPVNDMVRQQIDASPRNRGAVRLDSALATSWTGWSDTGGDHGYSTRIGDRNLLVWGPKDGDVRRFVSLLTKDALQK